MSQKVNPNNFRVNITNNWESEWYAENKYSVFIQEDLIIREYLMRKLSKRFTLGSCIIQRQINNTLTITLSLYTNKLLKKRKKQRIRAELREILDQLAELLNKTIILKTQRIYRKYKKNRRNKRLKFHWRKFYKLYLFLRLMFQKPDIYLIAQQLKIEFEKEKRHTNLIQFLKREIILNQYLNKKNCPLMGIKIQFKGKLNGRQRGAIQSIQIGQMPLNRLSVPIQYTQIDALTRTGVCGIKIWLAYKI